MQRNKIGKIFSMNLKNYRQLFTFPLALTFMFLNFSHAHAETLESINVATIEVAPFGLYQKGNNFGLYYEFGNKIVERAGYKPNNKIVPFARAHESVISGIADFTIMFSTDALEMNAHQSKPIIEFENLIIPAKHFQLKKLSDVNNKRIGIIRAGCADLLAKKELTPKFSEFNDYDQGVNLLINGRVDGICGSIIPVRYSLAKLNRVDEFVKKALVVSKRKAYVHFSKKLPQDKIDKINKAINDLIKENYFQNSARFYLNPSK